MDNINDLRRFVESISQEEKDRQLTSQIENIKKQYEDFTQGLKSNYCYLCKSALDTFDETKPCFHWFTYPSGIKKKHFEKYLSKAVSFFDLDAYLRWLANSENPIININDLKDEVSKTSYLETTYRYKNIEWAFSIGHNDKAGHQNAQVGNRPHYHIQMLIDNRIFLKFNDFHIQFTDKDLFNLTLLTQVDNVKLENFFGLGIDGIADKMENFDQLNLLAQTSDYENAPFDICTIIEMDGEQTIPDVQLQMAIEESKRTKKTVAEILRNSLKKLNPVTIISPSGRIPEMKKRSGKK